MPLNMGDVTAHSGWTLHCADAADNMEVKDRYAFSITFVDGATKNPRRKRKTCGKNHTSNH